MLAEYPSSYTGAGVHVELHAPSFSSWLPTEGSIFEDDFLPCDDGFSNSLYYERFQDFDLYEDFEEDDDDNLIPSVEYSYDVTRTEEPEPILEIPSENICGSGDSDYVQSTFTHPVPDHALDDRLSVSADLPSKDPSPPVTDEAAVSIECAEEIISSNSQKSSKTRGRKNLNWGDLSRVEKQQLLEGLLDKISYSLGPRVKLEAARILDTDISSASYEFSVDAENLSEDKVTRIEELLEEATKETCEQQRERSRKVKCNLSNKGTVKKSKVHKRGGSSCRHNQSIEKRERLRKECRQNTKEKRSGLFEQEEVISLYCDVSSDEEIDIL